MSVTVDLDESESVRLTNNEVGTQPPDRLEFSLRGRLTASETMLAEFAGATLNPVRVTLSTGDDAVTLDLTESASLRLEAVDVGVASPDWEGIRDDLDALSSAADGLDGIDPRPDVLAFTAEGAIRDASQSALGSVAAAADPRIESLTFAVGDTVESDGGSEPDVVLSLSLFGYGVTVRRDGTLVVGSDGSPSSIDLP